MRKTLWNIIVSVNFVLIFFFWFSNSSYLIKSQDVGDIFIAFGRITGLLSAYLILIQLFLVSRFSFIEKEYGFDNLNKLHRWIGHFLGIFIISHPLFLTIGYASINNVSYFHQFISFQTSWEDVLPATIAFLIIIMDYFIKK